MQGMVMMTERKWLPLKSSPVLGKGIIRSSGETETASLDK